MTGNLSVRIIGAKDLPDWAEDAVPHLHVEYHHKQYTQAAHGKGRSVTFDEPLSFPLGDKLGKLELRIFDKGRGFGPDDHQGRAELDIKEVESGGGRATKWLKFHGKQGGQHAGEVQVEVVVEGGMRPLV